MARSRKEITSIMLGATAVVAGNLKARSIFAYIDEFEDDKPIRELKNAAAELILVARNQDEQKGVDTCLARERTQGKNPPKRISRVNVD